METAAKVYVAVVAFFDENGNLFPKSLRWQDEREFEIEKVLDVRPAAALKAGGQGDRYTVQINGRQRWLFFERSADGGGTNLGRWFVEVT